MVASFAEEGANKAGLRMGVAGLDVAGVVFYSELFPNFLRARGLRFTIAVFALTNILYLQVAPTAGNSTLYFILLTAIEAVGVWIFIPETKAIPLEEMARIFGDDVAVHEADIRTNEKTHELVVERRGA
ncbi:hypothetical protein H2200_004191 [Cladophialophora chaetospira]|uniref:Major facilitator superfamily (MFS) profile domain-containing protein n=1 Tax=Cladophialophora chaetospira TaxID=386627 RepID=A0AA38XGH0_9EURO|nr:hypothetical protein H2200_004191 [Cladophialophora chaetospira]